MPQMTMHDVMALFDNNMLGHGFARASSSQNQQVFVISIQRDVIIGK